MSNETKRDVMEKLIECYAEVSDAYTNETGSPYYCDDEPDYIDAYDAALPDDLPVIPEAISDAVKFYWTTYGSEKGLTDLLFDLVEPWRIGVDKVISAIHEDLRKYYLLHSDVIARAWVLGVWHVEETGEIVKLDAED